jgi:hypothetical protein
MAKVFRPSNRESSILSRIESSKERARRFAIKAVIDCMDTLSNAIAMKLVETKLVETTNKNGLEEQIHQSLDKLTRAEDFDIDYRLHRSGGSFPTRMWSASTSPPLSSNR